ncbi:hypothetical protein COCON_G00073430 [Conger conger]|uniref:Melanocortin-2 receptor accessory protein n=1 Tax=Conger conger TaxID=82655 RepID=A0A9Q1DN62_CONCO|nr:melanocortin-2 receptor accessory protein-like [Conger conger]KAJ8275591.1 hypothetical protein COCON_G00073430 [Conger conger]
MRNATNSPEYEWEYYYDYLEPVPVDETQLKFHKYSIVIIFWVGMAGFVALLFLVLLQLSRSGNTNMGHNSKKSCLC